MQTTSTPTQDTAPLPLETASSLLELAARAFVRSETGPLRRRFARLALQIAARTDRTSGDQARRDRRELARAESAIPEGSVPEGTGHSRFDA